jgi:phenylalanyl-tRNA synthetase beta chain
LPEAVLTRSQWAERAVNLGFDQAMTYSFISPEQQTGWGGNVALTLSNPMSTDMSVMRSSLLPGLLQAVSYNLKRQQNDVRLFEVGTCFVAQAAAELPAESLHLAMLACGKQAPMHWAHKPGGMDFFAMKGDVEQLLAPYCSALRWQVSERPTLHPGRAADIYLGDVCIGWVGQLHPLQQKLLGIKPSIFAAELNLSLLPKIERVQFAAISRFPEVRRDLALLLNANVSASALLDAIAAIAGKKLKNCAIFDVYSGDHLEADLKSIAVSLTLVDAERTLVDDEVDDIIHSVVNGLESQFSAQLRA